MKLLRISASSDVVFGTERPQNLLHEPYPDGMRWDRRQEVKGKGTLKRHIFTHGASTQCFDLLYLITLLL